jgi:2-polyprenyl-3-methyl-5-hydroxy-6-metoxy-1,4-benzoquinol methylase
MTTQTLPPPTFDPTKAEAFAGQMLNTINSAALTLMMSIGYRTELFDTMAELPPSTSQQIANAASLNERYVREWLGAMVTGRLVDYDPIAQTYNLPAEHAAFLTRSAGANNFALFAQFPPMLALVEDQVIDCFYHGGGVPYSEFKRFHTVMAEASYEATVMPLVELILPLVPGLTEALQQGIDVLDVGCGCGKAINALAAAFPHSRFTGYDFSSETIRVAQADAERQQLNNVEFQVCDAATMVVHDRYDLITTFDAIHDQAKPQQVLHNIYQALRDDGIYLMQEIRGSSAVDGNLDHPLAPYFYTVSCMHCMTVSLAYGGAGLGAMWGQQTALQMLAEAGFNQAEIRQIPQDIVNDYYIIRKQ